MSFEYDWKWEVVIDDSVVQQRPQMEKSLKYKHIFHLPIAKRWCGIFVVREKRITIFSHDEKSCASLLNKRCEELGFECPNQVFYDEGNLRHEERAFLIEAEKQNNAPELEFSKGKTYFCKKKSVPTLWFSEYYVEKQRLRIENITKKFELFQKYLYFEEKWNQQKKSTNLR